MKNIPFKFVEFDDKNPSALSIFSELEKQLIRTAATPEHVIVLRGLYRTSHCYDTTWGKMIALIDTMPLVREFMRENGMTPLPGAAGNSIGAVAIPRAFFEPDFDQDFLQPIHVKAAVTAHRLTVRVREFQTTIPMTAEVRELLVQAYKEFTARYEGGFCFNPGDDENE